MSKSKRKLYKGKNGGTYYNKNGRKVYIKKDKLVSNFGFGDSEEELPEIRLDQNATTATIILKPSQKFNVESGGIIYIKEPIGVDIKSSTGVGGKVGKAIIRKVFTKENFVINRYEFLEKQKKNDDDVIEITIAPDSIGEVIPVELMPGEHLYVTEGAYLGSTYNLDITFSFQWKGLISNEDMFQSKIQNNSKSKGYVILGAFGNLKTVILDKNERFKVDNGLYVASNQKFTLSSMKNVFSFIFGGEGIFMGFDGSKNENKDFPVKVIVQSRDPRMFKKWIRKSITQSKNFNNFLKKNIEKQSKK